MEHAENDSFHYNTSRRARRLINNPLDSIAFTIEFCKYVNRTHSTLCPVQRQFTSAANTSISCSANIFTMEHKLLSMINPFGEQKHIFQPNLYRNSNYVT